jgi:FixJ family two-component response regulator
VITDLVMPEMSGQQLFERAHELPRMVPFLFMSGYSEQGVPSKGTSAPAFLRKPFTPRQLLHSVRLALGDQAMSPTVEGEHTC